MADIRSFVEASLGKPMKWQLEKTKKFLANDRKVLLFYCSWDDPSLFGEKRKYKLNYFLADDTIEVTEIHEANDGREKFPKLLGRCKLPKQKVSVGSDKIGRDHSDKIEVYTHADLRVGTYISVYGRHMLLTSADEYTKKFYINVHKLSEADFEPIDQDEKPKPPPKREVPPYTGYGTEEDSLGSVYSLVPKPPRKDYAKLLKYDDTILRFLGKFKDAKPEDVNRRFTVDFFLADDNMRIYEQESRNSGFVGGKFLDKCKVKNGATNNWFQATEFFVGANLKVNGIWFELVDADEATYKVMVNNCQVFTSSDLDVILKELADKFWGQNFSKTKTFLSIDKDKDQKIDVEEFNEICKKWGWNLNEHKKKILFRKFDTDGSGSITFSEFYKSLEKFKFDPAARQSACADAISQELEMIAAEKGAATKGSEVAKDE